MQLVAQESTVAGVGVTLVVYECNMTPAQSMTGGVIYSRIPDANSRLPLLYIQQTLALARAERPRLRIAYTRGGGGEPQQKPPLE